MASSEKITHVSLNSWQNKDTEDEDRITKFHVVCSQMKENIVLQQLIVIARLPHGPADVTELGDHYENLILELSKRHIREHITGLLLIYPTCLLHVIESSREMLNSVLKDMQQQPESVLRETKVVFMTHNLRSRLFNQWSYKVLDADQAADTAAVKVDEDENTEALVCSVLSALQQLNKHQVTPEPELDENPELIISSDILEKLLSRGEFLSPQQHLDMYNSPLNISIEIDQAGVITPVNLKKEILNLLL